MAKRCFLTICHDFELHMAMINSHAHLRYKGCLRFSSISDKIRWISDRFRQMSPKSSVNVDVAVFWLHCYFWSICRHRFSGIYVYTSSDMVKHLHRSGDRGVAKAYKRPVITVEMSHHDNGRCPRPTYLYAIHWYSLSKQRQPNLVACCSGSA